MEKVWKKIKDLKLLWIYLGITLLFFGLFRRVGYATDTYIDIMSNPMSMFTHFLGSGRFVTAIFYLFFTKIGLSFGKVYLLSFICAILSLAIALYLLHGMLARRIKNNLLVMFLTTLILINPFTVELFMYAEYGIMVGSVLGAVLCAKCFLNYMDNKGGKWLAIAMLAGIFATACYQAALGVMIVLMTLFILLEKKGFKSFAKYTALSIVVYGVSAASNLLLSKLFAGEAMRAGGMDIAGAITQIVHQTRGMITYYGMAPFKIIVLSFCIVAIWYVYRRIKNGGLTKGFRWVVTKAIYLAVVVYLAAVLPQLAQGREAWLVARSVYVYAAIIGVLEYFLLANLPKNDLRWPSAALTMIVAGLMALVATWTGSTTIIMDHYIVNALDQNRVNLLVKQIKDYEAESGTEIQKIALYPDKMFTYSYPGLATMGDINVSAFAASWSDMESINYWSGLNLMRAEDNAEMQDYCAMDNWDYEGGDGLTFVGDTVYICKF